MITKGITRRPTCGPKPLEWGRRPEPGSRLGEGMTVCIATGAEEPDDDSGESQRQGPEGPDSASLGDVLRDQRSQGSTLNGDEFLALYEQLYRLARRQMAGQSPDHTLQPTALLNEAWLRMNTIDDGGFNDRNHFLAIAATVMRQVLVDHARGKNRKKRRAPGERVALDGLLDSDDADLTIDIVALDDALNDLMAKDPGMVAVVELRFFAGLTVSEAAEVLGRSKRSIERDWTFARNWLHERLA